MMALTYSLRPATGFHGQLILNVGARRSGIKDSLLLTAGIIGGCPRLLHFLNSSSALARWLTAASIFSFTRAISLFRMAMRAWSSPTDKLGKASCRERVCEYG